MKPPQETTLELIDKFLLPIIQRYVEQNQEIGKGEINVAKQIAIIHCNLMIDELKVGIDNKLDKIGTPEQILYWQAVLKELEK